MPDPSLLVPCSAVPETLPAGLPAHCTVLGACAILHDSGPHITVAAWSGDWGRYAQSSGLATAHGCRHGFFLDLSQPPVDDAGNPLRMDALGWAVETLVYRLVDRAGWGGRNYWATIDYRMEDEQTALVEGLRLWIGNEDVRVIPLSAIPLDEDEFGGPHPEDDMALFVASALSARVGLEGGDD